MRRTMHLRPGRVLWSTLTHLRLCRRIADLYGFSIKVHRSTQTMPLIRGSLSNNVAAANNVIHISNPKRSKFIPDLWHEIGHLVAGDARSRRGVNWVRPLPAHIDRNDSRDLLEEEACDATATLVRLFRVPRKDRFEILARVAYYDWCSVKYTDRGKDLARAVYLRLRALGDIDDLERPRKARYVHSRRPRGASQPVVRKDKISDPRKRKAT